MRLLLLLLCLVSAASAVAQFGNSPFNRANMIDWRTFQSGTSCRFNDPEMVVIPTENDFQMYWQRSTGNPPGTAPRNVDWAKEKLVAIHLGTRPSSGYAVKVQNIVRNVATATIYAVEETPPPGMYVAQMQTSPYVIVKVDHSAVDFKLSMSKKQGVPTVILGPGGAYFGPGDNDGAGWVDLKYQCDWRTFRQGTDSRLNDPQMVVMNHEGEFAGYFQKAFGGAAPNSGIDWFRYQLVAIHIGRRDTSGYAVSVRNVIKNGGYGTIRVVEETPIPGQYVTRRPTSPFAIIKVERGIFQFQVDMSVRQAKQGIGIVGGGS